jgi:hypothetical protein
MPLAGIAVNLIRRGPSRKSVACLIGTRDGSGDPNGLR